MHVQPNGNENVQQVLPFTPERQIKVFFWSDTSMVKINKFYNMTTLKFGWVLALGLGKDNVLG